MVIRGIYPGNGVPAQSGQAYNTPDAPAAVPAAYAAPAAAPAPMSASSGAYGGGFLEMLMTGGRGAPAQPPQAAMPQNGRDMQALAYQQGEPQAAQSNVQRTIDPIYLRQEVEYSGPQRPGTIVIDTPHKFLYLVEKGGRALRYGIGVGRPGFTWSGVKTISRKAEWPDWTPPADMLKRRPDLPTHMAGGPENPLGARALYLGSTLYRIHGTNEPYTIGTNVSSGCIRMMNQDVEDLYGRVGVGTKVIIM
ncbi:MAG: L,D-transpeptidase [Methylovirgula sp.]